jgi:hypothetical protein
MKMLKKLAGVVLTTFLAACSSGPSESDIQAIVKKQIEESNKQMAAFGSIFGSGGEAAAKAFSAEVPGIKKLGCKEDGERAYKCDLEISSKGDKRIVPARFVKGSDGWVATN